MENNDYMDEMKSTDIDPNQELLLSECGLTSVITFIEAKQEQQHKAITELIEKNNI
jgi:hypothetical protein